MALELHRQAEDLMIQADRLSAMGDSAGATKAYREAARVEYEALQQIPQDRRRTRGIILVSAIALYWRAGALDEASKIAYAALANETLEDATVQELEDLLDDIRAERRARRLGQTLALDTFEWSLRGKAVTSGQAPIELVSDKIRQIDRLCVRIYEYLTDRPLRKTGPVPGEVRQGYEMLVSQPSAGSFRFSTRFRAPDTQLEMFESDQEQRRRSVSAQALSDQLGAILAAAEGIGTAGFEEIVSKTEYQEAFLRIIRDIAPDGRDLDEVKVTRRGGMTESHTILHKGVRLRISDRLAAYRPAAEEENELRDVLRAVHLNKGWIVLGPKGNEQLCYVGEAMVLEDVVEGLINRRVRVRGHRRGKRFYIDDIEEDIASSES